VAEPADLIAALRAYGLLAGAWVRASRTYRISFWINLAGNAASTLLDFVVLLIMFLHVRTLGGLTLPQVAFLYGTATLCLGLADLALGSLDTAGRYVREGSLDVLLVRPAPALVQLAAERFALRRVGRVAQGAAVLGWALSALPVHWTWGRIAMVPLMVLSGAVIFGAVFVAGAAFQLVAPGAAEAQNAVTYGGATLLQYPPGVFARELVRGVVYGVPLAFVNWLPAAYVLGLPAPAGVPGVLRFGSPPAALLCVLAAGLAWRAGLRAYRSTGS
jgi:ABC-2 type transport system permease protein